MLKRISIIFGVLITMCVACYLVYNVATVAGESAGYNKGYTDGQEAGYSTGKKDGQEEGVATGKKEGYKTGYDEGYESGVQASLGHGYTLRDPTYAEVLEFLAQDKTSDNEYNDPVYVCTHFARDTSNNAENQGIRCAFVDIRHPGMGHAIIAFNTVDKGLVYIEPQFDDLVEPVLGKKFHECIVPKEDIYYPAPDYDDTINDILVIW